MNKSIYFAHIDGLRAIAVLSVFLFHLGVPGFSGGYVGVDVFFVISGFLITRILKSELEQTGRLDLSSFYSRRVKRLGPALFVSLFVTFIVSMLVFSPSHLQRIGGALASSVFSVSNFFFWLEADYFDTSANLKPFLHTWSLSVEEQFYLLWPLSLLIFYRLKLWAFVLPALIVASFASLFLNFVFADGHSSLLSTYFGAAAQLAVDGKSTLFFLLPFRIFEFGIGAALVWGFEKRLSCKVCNDLLTCSGLGLILYAISAFDESILFPYWYALIPCIGTALVLYAGSDSYLKSILTNRVVVSIGLISYSLYLLHWPIIVFWRYLNEGVLDTEDQVFIFILALVLAFLSYRFIEQPFRRPTALSVKPAWSYAIVALTMALLTSGVHAYSTGGWAWRIGEPIVNLDDVGDADEFHKAYYGGAGYPYYGPVGKGEKPDIVLMGDSHGRHYAEGLNDIFVSEENLTLFVASGTSCFHLPGFTRTTKGNDWDSICPQSLGKAISYVKRASVAPVVIVSHAWSSQIPQAALIGDEKVNVGVNQVTQGLLRLKEAIGDSPLVVIGNLPKPGGNLYDIFTRPRPILFSGFEPASYLFNAPEIKLKGLNDSLKDVAETTNAFVFVDPFEHLCSETRCRNTDDQKRLLYSDPGHLSKYGSLFLIDAIRPVIEQALKERPNS